MEVTHPGWSKGQRMAFVGFLLCLLILPLAELARMAHGWPTNDGWFPPVAGPGDETYVYLPDRVQSVKGYWAAQATVFATDSTGGPPIQIVSSTRNDSWGNRISVKSSEKNTSSTLWVRLHLPPDPKLANRNLRIVATLNVTYPKANGNTFEPISGTATYTGTLQTAAPNAGSDYRMWWWIGMAGAGGFFLLLEWGLVIQAKAFARQGLETKIYSAQ